jgi:serine/threonine protein kinase
MLMSCLCLLQVLKEVRLLQSLDHPNIVSYLDSFLSGDELVIVVEWAAAGDLKRQVQ